MSTATAPRTIAKVTRPTIRRCYRCTAPRASHECREGRRVVHYACAFCAVKWSEGSPILPASCGAVPDGVETRSGDTRRDLGAREARWEERWAAWAARR